MDLTKSDPVFEYMHGQMKPGHPELLASYLRESEEVLARMCCVRNAVYGEHQRCRYDLFMPSTEPVAIVAFLHAGYWQSRDKDQFAFIAKGLMAAGCVVAMVNYPLCPDVSLNVLVEKTIPATSAIRSHLSTQRMDLPFILAGHSAGAHLAVELAGKAATGLSDLVDGIFAISGVYDLVPLVDTPLNDKLLLTRESAKELSALNHVSSPAPPAVFSVGQNETNAFHMQSYSMYEAWIRKGGICKFVSSDNDDHFSILRSVVSSTGGALSEAFLELIPQAEEFRRKRLIASGPTKGHGMSTKLGEQTQAGGR